MINYEFKKTSRKCSATGEEFERGEEFISALIETDDGDTERLDFSIEAWQEPPKNCIGWWKSKLPLLEKGKIYWAPREILLNFFEHLHEQNEQSQEGGTQDASETLYVMSLLLVRKHILKMVETVEEDGVEYIRLRRSADKSKYKIRTASLSPEKAAKIQEELSEKLFTSFSPSDEPADD